MIRDLLPREDMIRVLADITQILDRAGWLLPGFDPLERVAKISAACGDPDPSFKQTYQQVFNLESFHSLPHHPALRRVMTMLVGERLLVHPKPIGRLIFPKLRAAHHACASGLPFHGRRRRVLYCVDSPSRLFDFCRAAADSRRLASLRISAA